MVSLEVGRNQEDRKERRRCPRQGELSRKSQDWGPLEVKGGGSPALG